jgi:hypothetical protein
LQPPRRALGCESSKSLKKGRFCGIIYRRPGLIFRPRQSPRRGRVCANSWECPCRLIKTVASSWGVDARMTYRATSWAKSFLLLRHNLLKKTSSCFLGIVRAGGRPLPLPSATPSFDVFQDRFLISRLRGPGHQRLM